MEYQDKAVDAGDKDRLYYKVKLSDGSKGWAPDYGLVTDQVPSAITDDGKLHKRPDLPTVTSNWFLFCVLVAVPQEKDGWIEVVDIHKHLKG